MTVIILLIISNFIWGRKMLIVNLHMGQEMLTSQYLVLLLIFMVWVYGV